MEKKEVDISNKSFLEEVFHGIRNMRDQRKQRRAYLIVGTYLGIFAVGAASAAVMYYSKGQQNASKVNIRIDD